MKQIALAFALVFPLTLSAQSENKYIRQGNREYNKAQYEEAEVSYRKANEQNSRLPETVFNIGDALYRQEKYDEASKQFTGSAAMNEERSKKAAGLYNLGNSYLQSGMQKENSGAYQESAELYKKSIESYKESLKLQPNNFEAKYNLAYAQDILKQQEQQEQNQQNQDNQDNQNSEDNQQQNQDNQDQDEQQQQQEEQSISREDAERLLNSLANDEKELQEKLQLEKAARERRNTVKNW